MRGNARKKTNKTKYFVIIAGLFIVLVLYLLIGNTRIKITGKIVDTYKEDLKLYNCSSIKWDKEKSDYEFTVCPDDKPIVRGVGIAVTKDDLSGGRIYCCQGENLEIYDCKEESLWEIAGQDYKVTVCPADRPIMKGISIKVENDNQAGGKVYCCKGKNVELSSCAYTNYWKDYSSKDNELTMCPDDKQVMGGAGFNVNDDGQEGGKVYCCKGKIELKIEVGKVEEKEEENLTKIEEEEERPSEEEKVEEEEKESSVGKITEFLCKLFYSRNSERYNKCIGKR